jgi:hypothetical protein
MHLPPTVQVLNAMGSPYVGTADVFGGDPARVYGTNFSAGHVNPFVDSAAGQSLGTATASTSGTSLDAGAGEDAASAPRSAVLFGGQYQASETATPVGLSDTWTWDGERWTQNDVAGPAARSSGTATAS